MFVVEEDEPGALGPGRALGDFVSSCCPRLRRLLVSHPRGLRQLALRSEALEELEMTCPLDLRTLDVTASNLRAVRLSRWDPWPSDAGNRVARIAAPRLEEIGATHVYARPPELDIRGLTSVRRLANGWATRARQVLPRH